MKFQTIRADEAGQSHFHTVEVPDQEVPFGPPPNPTGFRTELGPVESMFLFSVPAGTDVPAHNAPKPYICIILSGECAVIASNGDSRQFGPGDVLFCDDLTGKGHVTRARSDVVAAFVNRTVS